MALHEGEESAKAAEGDHGQPGVIGEEPVQHVEVGVVALGHCHAEIGEQENREHPALLEECEQLLETPA